MFLLLSIYLYMVLIFFWSTPLFLIVTCFFVLMFSYIYFFKIFYLLFLHLIHGSWISNISFNVLFVLIFWELELYSLKKVCHRIDKIKLVSHFYFFDTIYNLLFVYCFHFFTHYFLQFSEEIKLWICGNGAYKNRIPNINFNILFVFILKEIELYSLKHMKTNW